MRQKFLKNRLATVGKGLAVIALFTLLYTGFSIVFAHKAHAAGWRATNADGSDDGTVISSSSQIGSGRFKYLTPLEIQDTQTGTIYKASDSGFWAWGGAPRAGGWQYYYPYTADGKQIDDNSAAGVCHDFLASHILDNSSGAISGENFDIKTYLVQSDKENGGGCNRYGSGGPPAELNRWIDISDPMKGPPEYMAFAVLYWIDQNTLGVYGRSEQLKRLNSDWMSSNDIDVSAFSNIDACKGRDNDPNLLKQWLELSGDSKGAGGGETAGIHIYVAYANGARDAEHLDQCMLGWGGTGNTLPVPHGVPNKQGRVFIAKSENASKPEGSNPNETGGGSGSGSTNSSTGIDCDAVSWNPLKWFMCPLLHLAESAVRQLDNLITYMLTFPTADYFDNSNNSLGNAWGSMRNLSLGLLVIAGLVMVISQAVSWGPFDAYTIKKVMPRLVFAVIFISISLPILRIMIEFSNVAGVGIRELIERLFDANFSNGVTFNNGALTIGTVAVGAAGLSLGFLGILSLMGTAILAVLIAFLVLTARQLLILMLVIVAPIAIACYILPNTERVWKMWWDFFWRALVAFPIISAFIATGHAFAKVASYSTTVPGSDSTLHDTLASLIAFAAYFGPYFALPFAFRLAGGAVGQIGGIVNDRSRGAFDRLKGFRKQQTAQNWQGMKENSRFKGNSALSRGMNRGLQTFALAPNAGINPAKWRSRMQASKAETNFNASMKAMEENATVKAVTANDTLLQAALHGRGTEADARAFLQAQGQTGRELNQNVAAIMRAKGAVGKDNFDMIATVANAGTGTGYGGGPGEMLEQINKVAGNDAQLGGQMLNAARQKAQGANRVDLHGASFGESIGQLQAMTRGTTTAAAANEYLTEKVLSSQSAGAILSARTGAVRNMVPAMQKRIIKAQNDVRAAHASGAPGAIADAERKYKQVVASTAGLLDVAAQVSPDNATELANGVLNMQYIDPVTGASQTLGRHIEALRNTDSEFQEMRREYAAAALGPVPPGAAAAAAAGGVGGPPPPGGPPPGGPGGP